jgi:hypothetical protein
MHTHRKLLSILVILFLSALACQVDVGGPEAERPDVAIPVSTEAVSTMKDAWQVAFDSAEQTGSVTITLTEQQLTSFLHFRLAEQESPLLTDPQVYLRDNALQVFGTANTGNVTATVRMVINATVNEETGLPAFELTAVDFGPIPVPTGLLDSITTALNEAFTGQFGPVATGLRVEGIVITEGLMVISGRTK